MKGPNALRPAAVQRHGVSRHEQGFTLIEVMVALLIGMVVVSAVLAAHVATGRSSRMQSAYAEMNENAQIGLTLLTRDLQLAGYAQPVAVGVDDKGEAVLVRTHAERPVFGCAHGLAQSGYRNQVASWDATVCALVPGTHARVLAIVYDGDVANSVATSADLPAGCVGSGLPASEVAMGGAGGTLRYYLVRNRYYLAVGSSGRAELHCASAQG